MSNARQVSAKEGLSKMMEKMILSLVSKDIEKMSEKNVVALLCQLTFFSTQIASCLLKASGESVTSDSILEYLVLSLPKNKELINKLHKNLDALGKKIPDYLRGGALECSYVNFYVAVMYQSTQLGSEQGIAAERKEESTEASTSTRMKASIDASHSMPYEWEAGFSSILSLADANEVARRLKAMSDAADIHSAILAYTQFGEFVKKVVKDADMAQFKEMLVFSLTSDDVFKFNSLIAAAAGEVPLFLHSSLDSIVTALQCIDQPESVKPRANEVQEVRSFIFTDLEPNTAQRVELDDKLCAMRKQAAQEKNVPHEIVNELQTLSDNYFKNNRQTAAMLAQLKATCKTKIQAILSDPVGSSKHKTSFRKKLEDFLLKINALKLVKYLRKTGFFANREVAVDVGIELNSLTFLAKPKKGGR
jgi:hypothetical protein